MNLFNQLVVRSEFRPLSVSGLLQGWELPARRHLLLPWLALIGEIGRDSGHAFPINREKVVLEPTRSGRLYLYVNDAINTLGRELDFDVKGVDGLPVSSAEMATGRSRAWYASYLNNAGTATIRITPDD